MTGPIRVTVWNEGIHEATQPEIAAIYPAGIHGAIASGLRTELGPEVVVTTATLQHHDEQLSDDALHDTDVLLWWGHLAHDQVPDDVVDRVRRHVLAGMGLLVLHSGHFSKIFVELMGTTCSLLWRNDGDRELVWTVAPGHPIASGVPHPLVIDQQETYGEYFDIPAPDELIFISSFSGGEVFRSGATFTRGKGKIFYFSPGDQNYGVYHHPDIQRVIANGTRWAVPTDRRRVVPTVTNPPRNWYSTEQQPPVR
jgi:trehalose utilization protein